MKISQALFPQSLARQALVLLLLSAAAGGLRQLAPHGISWTGRWPTEKNSAKEAYTMMAQPQDPPFASLDEVIEIHDKNSATFLDARAAEEYHAGHIPRARNLPYYEMQKFQDAALAGLTKDAPIVIYCEGVGCELSFFLARELQPLGYTNMKIFYGGYPEWSNAGLEIKK